MSASGSRKNAEEAARHSAKSSSATTSLIHRFFRLDAEGRYFLRPEAFTGPAPDAAYLAGVREYLATPPTAARLAEYVRVRDGGGQGGDHPPAEITDEVLVRAIMAGPVSNPVFLDAADVHLVRAACFCCYHTSSRQRAHTAAAEFQAVAHHYSRDSHIRSNAFLKTLASFLRDATPAEGRKIRAHGSKQGAVHGLAPPDMRQRLRALADATGAIVAYSPHAEDGGPGETFWVYSCAASRKLLRHVAKVAKADGVRLRVGTAPAPFILRHKGRIQRYECVEGGADAKEDPVAFDFLAAAERTISRGGGAASAAATPSKGAKEPPAETRQSARRNAETRKTKEPETVVSGPQLESATGRAHASPPRRHVSAAGAITRTRARTKARTSRRRQRSASDKA